MLILFFIYLSICSSLHGLVMVHNKQAKPLGIYINCMSNAQAPLAACVQLLCQDIESTGQFTCTMSLCDAPPATRAEITALVAQGIHLYIIVNQAQQSASIEYRIYDSTTGHLIPHGSGCYKRQGLLVREWAHHLAQKIWSIITGQEGIFTSRIAYAKEIPYKKGICTKKICVADHNGAAERIITSANTVAVAPRWAMDRNKPLLFYSEYTNTNVRLMVIDGAGKKRVVSRYDGINMQPAFSPDGTFFAYSASRGGGACQIYLFYEGALSNITANDGNNICPIFNHDGTLIYYCTDAYTGNPQIMAYCIASKKHRPITTDGYCACPAYNPQKQLLAYGKMIDGVMQIYVYDIGKNTHKRLINQPDRASREECAWSPCGNYLAYVYQEGRESRIALYNCITGSERFITPAGVRCSYPAWSAPIEDYSTIFVCGWGRQK
jgi:tol-pal system beta propeller repeat protein TolB